MNRFIKLNAISGVIIGSYFANTKKINLCEEVVYTAKNNLCKEHDIDYTKQPNYKNYDKEIVMLQTESKIFIAKYNKVMEKKHHANDEYNFVHVKYLFFNNKDIKELNEYHNQALQNLRDALHEEDEINFELVVFLSKLIVAYKNKPHTFEHLTFKEWLIFNQINLGNIFM